MLALLHPCTALSLRFAHGVCRDLSKVLVASCSMYRIPGCTVALKSGMQHSVLLLESLRHVQRQCVKALQGCIAGLPCCQFQCCCPVWCDACMPPYVLNSSCALTAKTRPLLETVQKRLHFCVSQFGVITVPQL